MAQGVKQLRAVQDARVLPTVGFEPVVIVDADGEPLELGGGSSGPSQSAFDALAARVEALESE